MILKPSDLNDVHPWDSIMQQCEAEESMAWMVSKLAETGDVFREVPYEEYKKEWKGIKDKKEYEEYSKYLKSEDTIILFSKSYEKVYNKLKTQQQ